MDSTHSFMQGEELVPLQNYPRLNEVYNTRMANRKEQITFVRPRRKIDAIEGKYNTRIIKHMQRHFTGANLEDIECDIASSRGAAMTIGFYCTLDMPQKDYDRIYGVGYVTSYTDDNLQW
jgi:hypothetical protein